ncbi:carboxylate-amine ligase [Nocardioides cynanchi]|uniref:carboxylate-amine ligase n=1 Tax=Nocardioides cynanchi TaxID=2558918 RepID=UPI001248365E|nr:glutamate--cysteine ligase [Nocardioides cynanchi]
MSDRSAVRKVGVEEELLLVHPDSGELANAAGAVLHEHRAERGGTASPSASRDLEGELLRHMVETHTDPSTDLTEIGHQLRGARRTAIAAAEDSGVAVAAVATAPLGSAPPAVTANPRYERIVQEFGDTGRGAGTLGMHVHVDVADDEEGVRVIDGLRPWLPLLTALSANSPYASGRDTGYASWRQQVWTRWPTAGPAEPYGSAAEYRRVSETLIRLGAALDDGMLYYDARLSASYPTVEIRVADTCTDVDDALLVAALARALVETLAVADEPARPLRSDLLRAAWWRAARHGLNGDLVHPVTREPVRAGEALRALQEAVGPALESAGDAALVEEGLARLATAGTGARRQRQAFERTGDLRGVVADVVARTAGSAG